MDILTNTQIINLLSETITKQEDSFLLFDEIYLFGSVINDSKIPNDIDMLLIYSKSIEEISVYLSEHKTKLEGMIGFSIDLTVLNQNELKETDFLKRIKNYIRLK